MNSNWTTATGSAEASPSNLATPAQRDHGPRTVVGGTSLEVIGGTLVKHGPATHTTGAEAPAGAPINDTIRAAHGGVLIGRQANDGDRITIGGMQTSIGAAIAAGLITRQPDGTLAEVGKAEAPKDPRAAAAAGGNGNGGDDPSDKADEAATFTIGEEGEKAMTDIIATVQPGTAIKAMDEVIGTGNISRNTIEMLAAQAGVDPTVIESQVGAAWSGFFDAATSRLETSGIDAEAFSAFTSSNPEASAKMQAAARALVMSNDLSGLDDLRDDFLARSDRFMRDEVKAALTDAGYGFEDDGRGGLRVILVGGAAVPFYVAVRQGIVKFSTGRA
jgi:hypothetical protein